MSRGVAGDRNKYFPKSSDISLNGKLFRQLRQFSAASFRRKRTKTWPFCLPLSPYSLQSSLERRRSQKSCQKSCQSRTVTVLIIFEFGNLHFSGLQQGLIRHVKVFGFGPKMAIIFGSCPHIPDSLFRNGQNFWDSIYDLIMQICWRKNHWLQKYFANLIF